MSTKDRSKKRRLTTSPKAKGKSRVSTPEKQQTIFSMFSKQNSEIKSKETKTRISQSHSGHSSSVDIDSDDIQIIETPHRFEKAKPQNISFETSASTLQSPYFSPEKNKKVLSSRPQSLSKLSLKRKHKNENAVSSSSFVTDESQFRKSKSLPQGESQKCVLENVGVIDVLPTKCDQATEGSQRKLSLSKKRKSSPDEKGLLENSTSARNTGTHSKRSKIKNEEKETSVIDTENLNGGRVNDEIKECDSIPAENTCDILDHGICDSQKENSIKSCLQVEKSQHELKDDITNLCERSVNDDSSNITPCKSKSLSENECDKEYKTIPSSSKVSLIPDNENDGDPDASESGEVVYAVPYYLENFLLILKNIVEDEYYSCLFNETDLKSVKQFYDLSENGQKLYVRLFQRKYLWIRKSRIIYPKIDEDLTTIFDELVSCKFLHDESELYDLEIILKTLQVPDLKQLGKSLRINTNQPQSEVIKAVLKHSKKGGIGAFFGGGGQKGITDVITKRAQGFLGKCYKLVQEKRTVFIRILMLFSLHNSTGEEDEAGGGNQQLFQLLMSNIGKVVYPSFKIVRQQRVFNKREDLLRFETAMQINSDMMEAMERNDFETTFDLYTNVRAVVEELWKNKDILRHDRSLPEYLRVFSASSIYAQSLTIGVEVLQKKRNYKDAVTLLEYLLDQLDYRPDYRGRWYDRLALNLDQHLKNPGKALDVIKRALSDPRVRTGRRYSLFQRAQRLTNSKGKAYNHLQKRWKEFSSDVMASVKEAPKVTIQGRQMSCNALGYNWVTEDSCTGESEDVTFIKHVEEVALSHYAKIGYPEGLHGEGGTLTCLFGLYHWDLIFKDDISDVFHSPFQTFPLDIRTDHFYQARKVELEERLVKIKESSVEELHEMLESCWNTHNGTICSGINWERFQDMEHAKGLVSCMGGPILAGILSRMARDMRNTTSGVPDLIVWNTETKVFKVVEVKGPGDRLSTKQMLWLDYLVNLGVDAEVCYVEAVRAKKLKGLP